jgi:N-acetylglutamate synthase-like GNAT family acetyltransferase
VALRDDAIVGVLAISIEKGITWIDQLYQDPDAIDEGLGSHMLALLLPAMGRPVRLYTIQQHSRARHFFEAHGFCAKTFSNGEDNEERCPDILYELLDT